MNFRLSIILISFFRRENSVTTLDSVQAMCLPLGASVSLLIMFFFFDSMQVCLLIINLNTLQIE